VPSFLFTGRRSPWSGNLAHHVVDIGASAVRRTGSGSGSGDRRRSLARLGQRVDHVVHAPPVRKGQSHQGGGRRQAEQVENFSLGPGGLSGLGHIGVQIVEHVAPVRTNGSGDRSPHAVGIAVVCALSTRARRAARVRLPVEMNGVCRAALVTESKLPLQCALSQALSVGPSAASFPPLLEGLRLPGPARASPCTIDTGKPVRRSLKA